MTTPDRDMQERGRRGGLARALRSGPTPQQERMLARFETYCAHREAGLGLLDTARRMGVSQTTAERYERARRQRLGL